MRCSNRCAGSRGLRRPLVLQAELAPVTVLLQRLLLVQLFFRVLGQARALPLLRQSALPTLQALGPAPGPLPHRLSVLPCSLGLGQARAPVRLLGSALLPTRELVRVLALVQQLESERPQPQALVPALAWRPYLVLVPPLGPVPVRAQAWLRFLVSGMQRPPEQAQVRVLAHPPQRLSALQQVLA